MPEDEDSIKEEETAPGEEAGDEREGTGESGGKSRTSNRLWTPYGEPDYRRGGEAASDPGEAEVSEAGGEEISEEELRRRIEEALEHVTVADIVVDFLISLTSLAYQKMGIPHEVNEKYRDLDQAKLAIDSIDSLLKAIEGSVPEDMIEPLKSTLSNLKLNFAKES